MKGLRMKKDDDHRKKYAGECFNCMDLSENNCPLNLGELTFDNFVHYISQHKAKKGANILAKDQCHLAMQHISKAVAHL